MAQESGKSGTALFGPGQRLIIDLPLYHRNADGNFKNTLMFHNYNRQSPLGRAQIFFTSNSVLFSSSSSSSSSNHNSRQLSTNKMKPCPRNFCVGLGFHDEDYTVSPTRKREAESVRIQKIKRGFVFLPPNIAAFIKHFTKPQNISWNDFPAKIKNMILDYVFCDMVRGRSISEPQKRAIRQMHQISYLFGHDDCLPFVRDMFKDLEQEGCWNYSCAMGMNPWHSEGSEESRAYNEWGVICAYMVAFEDTAESLAMQAHRRTEPGTAARTTDFPRGLDHRTTILIDQGFSHVYDIHKHEVKKSLNFKWPRLSAQYQKGVKGSEASHRNTDESSSDDSDSEEADSETVEPPAKKTNRKRKRKRSKSKTTKGSEANVGKVAGSSTKKTQEASPEAVEVPTKKTRRRKKRKQSKPKE